MAEAQEQAQQDRRDLVGGATKLGAAAADVLTLPVRGALYGAEKIANGVGRVSNAITGSGTAPTDNNFRGSWQGMTPYTDRFVRAPGGVAPLPAAQDPRRPENGPGRVAPGSGPPLPKAGTPAPAPAAPVAPSLGDTPTTDTGPFTPIKTERGDTPYDMHTRVAHDGSRMLMMGGHHEGAMRALGQYRELSAASTAHRAVEAIRALAMGDVRKAIEVHNHDIPNGEQIVGYKPIDGGFEFQYASGKTEKGTTSGIAQTLSMYKDPAYVAQLGMKTAIARENLLSQITLEKYKHLGHMEVEQFKADRKVQEMMKAHQLDAGTIAGISRGNSPMDTATYVRMKSGGMFKLVEEPGPPLKDGKPGPVTTKLVPISGTQIPAGLMQGAAPGATGGSWQVNKLFSGE